MTNEVIFSDMEKDVIGEVMNISLGSSATSLSSLLGKRVEITVPTVNVISASEFTFESLQPAIGSEIRYTEGLDGVNLMILKKMDAKSIIEILMGQSIPEEEFQMDEINTSAICEVMNQMMGSAATALSEFIGKPINISTPIAYEIENRLEFKNKYFNEDDIIVAVNFHLFIEDIVESEFVNVMPIELAREMVSIFLKGTETDTDEDAKKDQKQNSAESKGGVNIESNPKKDNKNEIFSEDYDDECEEERIPLRMQKSAGRKPKQKSNEQEHVNVKPMEFDSFDEDEEDLPKDHLPNLELIMSVPLEISVEIGKTKKQIKDILEFSQGTVLELDKQAGALVDIVVNGQLIAKGEVVVVNDNFGVRVIEIEKKDELMKMTYNN
jgi:flagellar motor switch protein FliN/FliY